MMQEGSCPNTKLLTGTRLREPEGSIHRIDDYRLVQPGLTGKAVRVAVLDSGYQVAHDQTVEGVGLTERDRTPTTDYADRNGHGTACVNLIKEIATEASIVSVRIFDEVLETSPGNLIRGLRWALSADVHIIHLSLGTIRRNAAEPLFELCDEAYKRGIVIVAAARIEGHGWSFPSAFGTVLSVGGAAMDSLFAIEYAPNSMVECRLRIRGRKLRDHRGTEREAYGSSFVAPVVTGLVAKWIQHDVSLGVDNVRTQLMRFPLVEKASELLPRVPESRMKG